MNAIRCASRTSALNGDAAVEGVEQVAERARQDAFDLEDLVAAGDQVAQRRHDRQAGADVGFVEEVLPARAPSDPSAPIPAPRQRVGPLVRRDDVQVGVDERRIRVDHRRVGGAVDQRRVGQLQRRQALASPSGVVRRRDAPSAAFQFARSMPTGDTTNRRLLASATTRTSNPRESR